MAGNPSTVRVLIDGSATTPRLDHPEGVAVHPADDSVWCGGEAGQVYRVDAAAQTIELIASTGGFSLGLAFDHRHDVLVCDGGRSELLRVTAGGGVEVVSDGADGLRLRSPNSCAVAADGTIYFSESRAMGDPGPGLFRVDTGGTTELWTDVPLDFANGIALTADGAALLVVESWARRVLRFPIGPDGQAGEPEVFVELPGTVPDGLAVSVDGAVWVACYQPSQVVRVGPDGEVAIVAEDPDAHLLCHPTNGAFRGEQLVLANLGRWHLSVLDAGVRGIPLPPPAYAEPTP